MGSTDSRTVKIPAPPAPTDLVTLPLSEIQRLRDELARIRHQHFLIARLHGQVAGLYQRLAPQVTKAQP